MQSLMQTFCSICHPSQTKRNTKQKMTRVKQCV
jgi:hypothetical protein